jgi:hypothetical protein
MEYTFLLLLVGSLVITCLQVNIRWHEIHLLIFWVTRGDILHSQCTLRFPLFFFSTKVDFTFKKMRFIFKLFFIHLFNLVSVSNLSIFFFWMAWCYFIKLDLIFINPLSSCRTSSPFLRLMCILRLLKIQIEQWLWPFFDFYLFLSRG